MSKYFWYALGGIFFGIGLNMIYDTATDESINRFLKKLDMTPHAEKTTPKAGS